MVRILWDLPDHHLLAVASAGPLGLGYNMTFKRLIENPSPSATPKKGGLFGRVIDHSTPSDHQSFEEARESGFKALRRSLARRKKRK